MPSSWSLSAASRVSGAPSRSASSAVPASAAAERVRSVCAAARGDETSERSSAIADHHAMRVSRLPLLARRRDALARVGDGVVEQRAVVRRQLVGLVREQPVGRERGALREAVVGERRPPW